MNESIFEKSYAKIYNKKYTIYSRDEVYNNAFINIIDEDGITVISSDNIEKYNKKTENWIRISIFIDAPPDSKGIASILTNEFAKNDISIVPIASFSKANIFVRKQDLVKAKTCLRNLAIEIKQ